MEIMRLVIEIPKELYDKLDKPIGDEAWLRYIIKNGMPISTETDTMRKYQKIQEIMSADLEHIHPLDRDPFKLAKIREVLEDVDQT